MEVKHRVTIVLPVKVVLTQKVYMQTTPEYATPREAADYMNVSLSTVRNLYRAQALPATRIGLGAGTVRIKWSDIYGYLGENEIKSEVITNDDLLSLV